MHGLVGLVTKVLELPSRKPAGFFFFLFGLFGWVERGVDVFFFLNPLPLLELGVKASLVCTASLGRVNLKNSSWLNLWYVVQHSVKH